MFTNKICKQSKAFTILELMMVIAIISILSAMAIPNFIYFRDIAYCTEAENDAANIGMAIANYFGAPQRVNLPNISDLNVDTNNTVEIIGHPDNFIEIRITDRTGRCPISYQQSQQQWDSNVFSKFVR